MAADVEFGRLADVEARLAWAHEAHAFTPWLAENLDRLSEVLGIRLELVGREVGVGRFSADLLATDLDEGRNVLIENQLAPSDHTHLGQLLTYLAGLEAQVVVWIAPTFREEHLSALRWLNQHTDERFAFFAVRLRVVRIGDSPFAPLLDVLEKPNSWERQLQQTVRREAAIETDAAVHRQAFWDAYARKDPEVAEDRRITGNTVRWRAVPGTGIVVSRFIAAGKVGIFLRGAWGQGGSVTLPRLQAAAATLEHMLGVPLGNPDYPFEQMRPLASRSDEDIETAVTWLAAETERYESAAADYLRLTT